LSPSSSDTVILVDGGLVSNIPTDLLAPMNVDVIVAVDVTAGIAHTQLKSVLAVMNQAIYIQSERLAQDELTRAQVVIRPEMGDIGAMDLSRSMNALTTGSWRAGVRSLRSSGSSWISVLRSFWDHGERNMNRFVKAFLTAGVLVLHLTSWGAAENQDDQRSRIGFPILIAHRKRAILISFRTCAANWGLRRGDRPLYLAARSMNFFWRAGQVVPNE